MNFVTKSPHLSPHYISIEPCLQCLTGETCITHSTAAENNWRLDIAASGFWGGKL